jgi:hypothetical protein
MKFFDIVVQAGSFGFAVGVGFILVAVVLTVAYDYMTSKTRRWGENPKGWWK